MIVLVTGGAGFIGSYYIDLLLKTEPNCQVINLDALTYAGNLKNTQNFSDNPRYTFVEGDICEKDCIQKVFEGRAIERIVHFAAESHVDHSLKNPDLFVRTNVLGTQNLLSCAKSAWEDSQGGYQPSHRYIQISTDEVYGSYHGPYPFREDSPLKPTNPYAASKAAGELLVQSYWQTYQLPTIITRACNNYGMGQHHEKFIPAMIRQALNNQPLPLYGDGHQEREWIHVSDHCRALNWILTGGKIGEVYNIGSGMRLRNVDVAATILKTLDKPRDLISFVEDRIGHDTRYAIDSTKIMTQFSWQPVTDFYEGLNQTIKSILLAFQQA